MQFSGAGMTIGGRYRINGSVQNMQCQSRVYGHAN